MMPFQGISTQPQSGIPHVVDLRQLRSDPQPPRVQRFAHFLVDHCAVQTRSSSLYTPYSVLLLVNPVSAALGLQ